MTAYSTGNTGYTGSVVCKFSNIGGGGPNPWEFSVVGGQPLVITPPTPLVYDDTRTFWPLNSREEGDSEIVYNFAGENRLLEQNIEKQTSFWWINIEYARSDLTVDQQLNLNLFNPVSGDISIGFFQFTRGKEEETGTFLIPTISNINSLPEHNGQGLQMIIEAGVNVPLVRILTLTRSSMHKDVPIML